MACCRPMLRLDGYFGVQEGGLGGAIAFASIGALFGFFNSCDRLHLQSLNSRVYSA
jgi:hypothetical protein